MNILVSGSGGSGDYRRGVLGPGSSFWSGPRPPAAFMEMDGAALTGFAAPVLKGFAKLSTLFFFFFLQKVGEGFGVLLSLSVEQLLTSKIGRGDNASPSFGSRCHVIYSLIYLFSGSEAERFARLPFFFFFFFHSS